MTNFRAEHVSRYFPSAQHAVCLNCRRAIAPDGRVVTFYAEGEPVGFVCNACVSSESRALLRSKKA